MLRAAISTLNMGLAMTPRQNGRRIDKRGLRLDGNGFHMRVEFHGRTSLLARMRT
jgi:hypothetical protein